MSQQHHHTQQQQHPQQPERDDKGRFAKGNPGGPGRPKNAGNPFCRHLGRTRYMWHSHYTHENIKELFDAVMKKALDGDVGAQRLHLQYLLGKPTPAPNPDDVDINELEYFARVGRALSAKPDLFMSPDHQRFLEIIRLARPLLAEDMLRDGRRLLRERLKEDIAYEEEMRKEAEQEAAAGSSGSKDDQAERETNEPVGDDSLNDEEEFIFVEPVNGQDEAFVVKKQKSKGNRRQRAKAKHKARRKLKQQQSKNKSAKSTKKSPVEERINTPHAQPHGDNPEQVDPRLLELLSQLGTVSPLINGKFPGDAIQRDQDSEHDA